jgi:CRP-like cAMP-binding protein
MLAAQGASLPRETIRVQSVETAPSQNGVLQSVAQKMGVTGVNELAFLAELESASHERQSGAELFTGHGNHAPRFVLQGWAARVRCLQDGRRQIVEFCLPGELLLPATNPATDAAAPALALSDIAVTDATRFLEAAHDGFARHDGLRAMHQHLLRRRERYGVDHVTRLGAQTAYERTAHLLVDFDERLALAELSRNHTFAMPLSQVVLAHALGLSVVHVNRVLQQMRREKLIELRGGRVCLLEPARLREVADFHRA